MVAGTVGLVGTWRLGPRLGIYNDKMIVGLSRSLSLSEDKDIEINKNLRSLNKSNIIQRLFLIVISRSARSACHDAGVGKRRYLGRLTSTPFKR